MSGGATESLTGEKGSFSDTARSPYEHFLQPVALQLSADITLYTLKICETGDAHLSSNPLHIYPFILGQVPRHSMAEIESIALIRVAHTPWRWVEHRSCWQIG